MTSSDEVALIIKITTKPGYAQNQIDAFRALAPVVRAEPGCLEYDLHQHVEHGNDFVLTERWATRFDLEQHETSTHMIEADAAASAFRSGAASVDKLP